jgi:CNT family concentrative nucleoside transporter
VERLIGLAGIAFLLGVAWIFSTKRRSVDWRSVAIGLLLQAAIAGVILRTSLGRHLFAAVNNLAVAFIGYANHGIDFVFGRWPELVLGPNGESVPLPFVFAVRVLPIIIFMGSVFSVLYHLGILQRVVDVMARGLRRTLRISGAESLATIANIFLGMTEAPLLVRPYVERMTRSELFCVMTAGLATVAGGHLVAASFMSAPAAVAIAKVMIPEEGTPATLGGAKVGVERPSVNVIDAAALGAADGMRLALNVGAMLIAFVALVYLMDDALGALGGLVGFPDVTLEGLLGGLLAPVAFLMGVPWTDAPTVGSLLGIKTVLNEFLAYQGLANALAQGTIEPRSAVIASYALCGFANFGSLAILLGGLGGIAPSRRSDLARDGLRAILAGSIATFMTGTIAGMIL